MDNQSDILSLCRLCLVKDGVNVSIFDEQDVRRIYEKINTVLPVKISKDDKLPKNICDDCSYKLEAFYDFCNISVNSEKQLNEWLRNDKKLNNLGGGTTEKNSSQATLVKQEALDPVDLKRDEGELEENKSYMFQQKFEEASANASSASAGLLEDEDEPPPPKRARRTAAVKAAIAMDQSDDEDDDDSREPLTKVEDDSDDSDEQDASFPDMPSTSADDQPGPSGVGRDGVEAPFFPDVEVEMKVGESELQGFMAETKTEEQDDIKSDIRTPKKKIKEERIDDEEYTPPGYKKKKQKTEKKDEKKTKKVIATKIRKQEHKIWTCRRCLEEFESRRELTDHTKVYHIQEETEANTFKYDEDQDIYICSSCSAEYQTKEEVEEHITKIHEEFYTCEICKHTAKKAYSFAVHMRSHTNEETYTCPLCSYSTPRRTCLQTHINRVHYHKFYYTCPTCGKGFNDSVIFKEHNNEHLGIKPFVCVVCNKDFVYSRYMLIHQTRYHTVHIQGTLHKTQCSICLKVFSKVATLLRHITTKHNTNGEEKPEKRHLCDMCGKGFGTSDKLKIHYRIHTGDKPFACRYCDKRFTKKDYLIMHERVHTGEKPYPCEYCGKCFNQAASLRIHVRGHTGERPYICHFCNGGYISRGSLNLHMKICNGVIM